MYTCTTTLVFFFFFFFLKGYLSRGDLFQDEPGDESGQSIPIFNKQELTGNADTVEPKESPKYLELPSCNGDHPKQVKVHVQCMMGGGCIHAQVDYKSL